MSTSFRLAWVFILLVVLAAYTPFSSLALLFSPIPLILLFAHDAGEWKVGITALGVGLLLLGFTGAWLAVALLMVTIGGFSYVLGRGLKTGRMMEAIVQATLIVITLYVIGLGELRLTGVSIGSYLAKQADQLLQSSASNSLLGTTSSALANGNIAEQITLYMPGIIVVLALFITLFEVAILRFVRRRDPEGKPILRQLRVPRFVVPFFAISLLAMLFTIGNNIPLLWELLNNVWMITTFLLTLQALSLVWWLLKCRLRYVWVICGLIVLQAIPAFSELLVIVGLLDILFDIRARRANRL
ncbi:MAG: DUF2232 domain-containing protein [Firmicutes bacterium]|nr:DUF2232 domain-containing protein [Bacillota bacterium]